MPGRLILASASPRRRDLLTEWHLEHEVLAPDIEEHFVPGLSPQEQSVRLAVEKALAVSAEQKEPHWVIAADTIVATGDRQLAKPVDEDDAQRMLMSLSGRDLIVVTGVAVIGPNREVGTGAETTMLTMRAFSVEEAAAYVASGEPMGKAGAFAIQGLGGRLIAARSGSRSNVVGLPRNLSLRLLRDSGYALP